MERQDLPPSGKIVMVESFDFAFSAGAANATADKAATLRKVEVKCMSLIVFC